MFQPRIHYCTTWFPDALKGAYNACKARKPNNPNLPLNIPVYIILIYYILRYIVYITYWYYLKIYVSNYNIVYTKSICMLNYAQPSAAILPIGKRSLPLHFLSRAAHCKPGCKDCTLHIIPRSDCWNLPRRTNHFTWHVNLVNPYKENA